MMTEMTKGDWKLYDKNNANNRSCSKKFFDIQATSECRFTLNTYVTGQNHSVKQLILM